MNRQDVLDLASLHADPAVSILLPLELQVARRHENEVRLSHMVTESEVKLERQLGKRAAKPMVTRLERIKHDVAQDDPSPGLAIYVTSDSDRVLPLPFPVHEQINVNTTFATRQLFAGLARHSAHRVLVLTEHRSRLFEDRGDGLREITTGGFPITGQPPHEQDAPHADLPIHEEAEREEHRIVYRAVDEALDRAAHLDPLPVILVATEREASVFTRVGHHDDSIVGFVHGSHANISPVELADLAQPVLERFLTTQAESAVHKIREAIGTRRAVTGATECWQAASVEGAHLLVVEDDFQFPEHLADGYLETGDQLASTLGAGSLGVIDDLVDEIIEHVARRGGEIVFVPNGSLADLGGIALLRRT